MRRHGSSFGYTWLALHFKLSFWSSWLSPSTCGRPLSTYTSLGRPTYTPLLSSIPAVYRCPFRMRNSIACRRTFCRTIGEGDADETVLSMLRLAMMGGEKKDLGVSRRLQFWMVCSGLESVSLYGNYLIRTFTSCSALAEACQVFLKISTPNVYTWNAIISAYTQLSQGDDVFLLFFKMQEMGVEPGRVTFLSLLKVCSDLRAIIHGKAVHAILVEMALVQDVFIGSTLVHMYGSCASLDEAHKVFGTLQNPNVVSWGALITGYAQYGDGFVALQLFVSMQSKGLEPGKAIFLSALKACGAIRAIIEGQSIHNQILRKGLERDEVTTSALVDMYGKCGRLVEVQKLFRGMSRHDAVSWASFVSAYAEHGDASGAIQLLEEMEQSGVMPDQVTFLCILKACSGMAGTQGRVIHDCTIRANLESNTTVANSLVDMYTKSCSLKEAQSVFSKLKNRNLVSCSAMISGYVQEGHGFSACEIFDEMLEEGIKPDRVTFLGALKACGLVGSICKGRVIHMYLIESSLDEDVTLGNTLVDMYGKCGSLQEAHKVFDMLSKHDMVSWRAIISGYSQQGDCNLAEAFVKNMQIEGLQPDEGIYLSMLAGCSYAGQLKQGYSYFKSLWQGHDSPPPSVELYNCMIDLLGRMGHLIEAHDMLQVMPMSLNLVGWSTLLSGSKTHGNTKVGTQCVGELLELDQRDASCYMIMSDLYSSTQNSEAANTLESLRRHARAWKKRGEAWIEIGTKVHEFVVGDHLEDAGIIPDKSNRLGMLMKKHGYLPDLDVSLESTIREKT